jgi:hypothetical protein
MKVKGVAPAEPLSEELHLILLWGPWKVGKTLRQIPPHDTLRLLWAVHGAALFGEPAPQQRPRAAMPRGQEPWFIGRDWFVTLARGEPA